MAIVLIAEDEYLVRVGLRTCLDWERHGFILLDDAVNGEDAYQKILRHRPDILLLDIKMPRMDGFALLAKLREENIDVHVIILSGCDDFDSVRTALQYGVLDYINKLTVTSSELLRALNKVPSLPTAKPPRDEQQPAGASPDAVFQKLLAGETCRQEELECLFPSGYVLCIFVAPRPDGTTVSSSLLASMSCQQLKNNNIDFIAQYGAGGMVVLLIPAGQDPMSCTATLYRQLHVTLDTMCAVGCSDLYCNPGEIYEKYTFARQIEELTYWGSAGGIRAYDGRLVPKADCSALVSSASKMIQNYIWLRDLYSTLHQIDVLAAALQEREDLTKDYFVHYMLSILALFPAKGMEKKFFTAQQQIVASVTWLNAKGALEAFAAQYFKENGFHSQKYSSIVSKAIMCVLDDPGHIVSLAEAAQRINVSESYLSQLFKRETGENYNSFVHRYKVNQAKEMLQSNMLIYEVCDKIGYENANYFAKLFRRYTGCTPNEYKTEARAAAKPPKP